MRTLRWMTLALGLIGGAVAVDAIADPPPWAPAHGWRAKHGHGDRYYYEEAPRVVHYRYVYYPEREIYYAPERGLWFWLDGPRWRGAAAPTRAAPAAQLPAATTGTVGGWAGSAQPEHEGRAARSHGSPRRQCRCGRRPRWPSPPGARQCRPVPYGPSRRLSSGRGRGSQSPPRTGRVSRIPSLLSHASPASPDSHPVPFGMRAA